MMWLYSMVVCTATLPCFTHRVQPTTLEAIYTFCISVAMLAWVFASPHYAGRLMGYDTMKYLEPRQLTDTFIILGLDALVTSSHIVLPIRFHLMLCVQVFSIFCYALPAAILGCPHPANFPHTLLAFSILIFVTGLGKLSLDRDERIQYVALIREKCLRVESELQLATYKDMHKAQKVTQKTSDDVESVTKTLSGTSTRGFGLGSDRLTFKALVELGLKEQWLIDEHEVQLPNASPLGEGSFGIVVQGRYHGANVALKAPKTIVQGGTQEVFLEASCNELRILRRLRHPNIVALYGAVLTSGTGGVQVCLVLELIKGESLKLFMTRIVNRGELADPSSIPPRIRILRHVAAALRYLHSRQPVVVHGDIKNTNIFVEQPSDHSVQAKLLDFGLSRLVKGGAHPMGGTLRWAAPEVLSGRQAPAAATDMFSFGRLAFYVSTGQLPFSEVPDSRQLRKFLLRSPCMRWPRAFDAGLLNRCRPLAEECTRPRPELRPSVREVFPILLGMEGQAGQAKPWGGSSGDVAAPAQPQVHGSPIFNIFAFESELSFSCISLKGASSEQLAAVPEATAVNPSSASDTPPGQVQRLAHGSYHPTPHETLMKAVSLVLMQSNHRVDAGGECCWLHSGLRRLRAVCSEIQEMPCDGWNVPVVGQCKCCRLLCIDGVSNAGLCNFCGECIADPGAVQPCHS
ncbi:unnamed protein product [Prorocentrum cordatum]|uniref:Protein kinase domain-containing protein n=1 Tax=Prorocentrum cordatum TaxID=2364126 RepID=A0ABN9TCU0_9DINO|nr:unnamed protein product [Polarella glacialis]